MKQNPSNTRQTEPSWGDRFLSVFLLAAPVAYGLSGLAVGAFSDPESLGGVGFWAWVQFVVLFIPVCTVHFLFQPLPVYGVFWVACRLLERENNRFMQTGTGKWCMGAIGCLCFCYPVFTLEIIRSRPIVLSYCMLAALVLAVLCIIRFKWCLIKNRTAINAIYLTATVVGIIGMWLTFTTYGITIPVFPH